MCSQKNRSQTNKPNRNGFTLVEILIVLTIVGVLIGLLLPAVQSVRESSRLTSCKNRIRELCLATANYTSTHGRLPPGTLGFEESFSFDGNWFNESSDFFWKNAQHTSFLGFLLPYVEQNNMYRTTDRVAFAVDQMLVDEDGIRSPDWFLQISGAENAISHQPEWCLCPSDNFQNIQVPTCVSQPVENYGTDAIAFVPMNELTDIPVGFTNFLACAGAHSGGQPKDPDLAQYNGAMGCRMSIHPKDIRDGLSNTMLIGESIGWVESGERSHALIWFVGGLGRGRGNAPWMQPFDLGDINTIPLGDRMTSGLFGFGSKHPQVVNFGLCDGSVRSITREIHFLTLYQFSGMHDGGVPVFD